MGLFVNDNLFEKETISIELEGINSLYESKLKSVKVDTKKSNYTILLRSANTASRGGYGPNSNMEHSNSIKIKKSGEKDDGVTMFINDGKIYIKGSKDQLKNLSGDVKEWSSRFMADNYEDIKELWNLVDDEAKNKAEEIIDRVSSMNYNRKLPDSAKEELASSTTLLLPGQRPKKN